MTMSVSRNVNKEIDIDSYKIQEDVGTYYEQNNELSKLKAEIRSRFESGRLPRFVISGPTGCGKTMLARKVAEEIDAPFFTIQCKYSMNEPDLIGSPDLVDGSTEWNHGPLSKAIISSRRTPTVLLLDEVNRARPESKGGLFRGLDERCAVQLEARDDRPIRGKKENLIVIATINEGREYWTEELDLAERRRLANKIELQYLGQVDKTKERDLIAEKTMVTDELSHYMVSAANDVRSMVEEDTAVQKGIPTSLLINWAGSAASYSKDEDIEKPVYEAAVDAVLRPFYGKPDEEESLTLVEQTIRNHIDDAPFAERSDISDWLSIEEESEDGELLIDADTLRHYGFENEVDRMIENLGRKEFTKEQVCDELTINESMVLKMTK